MQIKPWTVMVYLAADNNLTNFGIESLKQMKIMADERVNVVAEFDTDPVNPNRRFHFKGGNPFGPLAENELPPLPSVNAGDPQNLIDFIVWSATEYPAEHYFLIIWGHGGGVDDDFPHAPDLSFVHRHELLSLTRNMNGSFSKGSTTNPSKGSTTNPVKSILDGPQKTVLDNILTKLRKDIVNALKEALSAALKRGIFRGLQENKPEAARLPQAQNSDGRLSGFRTEILKLLEGSVHEVLQNGRLGNLQQRALSILRNAIVNAVSPDVLCILQRRITEAVQKNANVLHEGTINKVLENGIVLTLEQTFVNSINSELLDAMQKDMPVAKSLAFVDHPASYLTNTDLKNALNTASQRIAAGWTS